MKKKFYELSFYFFRKKSFILSIVILYKTNSNISKVFGEEFLKVELAGAKFDSRPGITYISVQKNHRNILFYPKNEDKKEKIVPPGTTIVPESCNPCQQDFFLRSQSGGTNPVSTWTSLEQYIK